MVPLQAQRFTLLLQTQDAKRQGDLVAAIRLGEQLVEANRALLELAHLYNGQGGEPIDTHPLVQGLLSGLTTLADHYQATGQLPRAEHLRDEAIRLSREYFGDLGDATALRQRAASLITQGRFNEALTALATSRDFFERERKQLEMARVTVDLAELLQWLGDFDRALQELDHAAKLVAPLLGGQSLSGSSVWAQVLQGIEEIWSSTGDGSRGPRAAELHRLSLELDYYRALLSRWRGEYDASDELLRRVLPEYQDLGVGPAIEFQMAANAVDRGDVEEGVAWASRLEPAFRNDQNLRPKYAALLKVQGEGLLKRGQAQDAVVKAREAIRELARYVDPDLLWRIQSLEARALEAAGQPAEALAAYCRAAATIGRMRLGPLGHRLDSTFLNDKRGMFDAAIALAAELGRPEDAWRLIEQIKSRTLNTVLSVPRLPAPGGGGPQAEFDEITRRLDTLEYEGYAGRSDRGQIEQQRAELLRQRAKILERIRFADPRWRNLSNPFELPLDQVMQTLSARGQAALDLFLVEDRVIWVLLKAGACRAGATPLDNGVRQRLGEYCANLQRAKPHRLGYDPVEFSLGAKHLLDPAVLQDALDSRGLIVAPHGLLHLLPWGSLFFQGKRLFEYAPVGILPNLSCVVPLRSDGGAPTGAGLIGDPDYRHLPELDTLKHAGAEIARVAELYATEGKLLAPPMTGPRATAAALRTLAARPDAAGGTLHLTCHGLHEPSEPMNSGLFLFDSKLDAAEIAGLRLNYNDVVLSACNTGWRPVEVEGIVLQGDDILGLPAAFLEAGARSVLVSIPQAGDGAARDLTVLYHRHRLGGRSPMAALQAAQQAMLASSHGPWDWVGFVLYGCQ